MVDLMHRVYNRFIQMSKQQPSNVLLVCVYDTVVFELTNDMIFNTFKDHAEVRKVLIFERGEVTKCFVELATKQEAIHIKDTLDGKKMFESFCKMHIYFSNLREVDLRNQFSKGKDYTSCDSDNSSNLSAFGNAPTKIEAHDSLKRAKTTNDKSLSDAINLINNEDYFEQCIKSDIGNLLEEEDYKETFSYTENTQAISNPLLCPAYRSEFLSFPYEDKLAIKEVYNLFSNFGNIEKIVKKPRTVYVQFSSIEFAAIAKDYLTNIPLFGSLLRLSYASKEQLQERPRQYSETVIYDEEFFRFGCKKSISINPPTNSLHVSNMKKEFCTQFKLANLFSECGTVVKVHILVQSKEKNMALVRFGSVEDSVRAMAIFHNHDILGRKLQISFTKSKF